MVGEPVVLKHYTSTDSFDPDTELPSSSSGTSDALVLVEDPSSEEIKNSGGLVTRDSKRFVFNKDVTVSDGDEITMASGYVYKISSSNELLTRTVAFADILSKG